MNSKRVRQRSQQALPTLWAAFACADVVAEAVERHLRRDGGPAVDPRLADSSRELFVVLGRNLMTKLRQLLAVDKHYQALRGRQRRYQARRDRIAQRLNRELVDVRRFLKGLLGYEGACRYLGLKGETAREPWALYHQATEAVRRAKSQQPPQSPHFGKREAEARNCLAGLEALCKELDEAIDDVVRGRCEVDAAMLEQRQVMKDFDRIFKESAKTMEAQLIGAGLPTLGDAVRPGVGRRGRPLKNRPVDLHPDLVARVRAEGLMALDGAPIERGTIEGELVKHVDDASAAGAGPPSVDRRGVQPRHAAGLIRKTASAWWLRLRQAA